MTPAVLSDEIVLKMEGMGTRLSAGGMSSLVPSVLANCFIFLRVDYEGAGGLTSEPTLFATGEESLTIFVDKRKLGRKTETTGSAPIIVGGSGNNSAVSLETLHQLAASYFIDRESTLRRLHHIQIATGAIKVMALEAVGVGTGDRPRETRGKARVFTSSKARLMERGRKLLEGGTPSPETCPDLHSIANSRLASALRLAQAEELRPK